VVSHQRWFKVFSWIVLAFQISFQLFNSSPVFASSNIPEIPVVQNQVPTTPIAENSVPEISTEPDVQTSVDFLLNSTSFSQADAKSEPNNYVTESYEQAADGIHELQPDAPVAYLAKDLNE